MDKFKEILLAIILICIVGIITMKIINFRNEMKICDQSNWLFVKIWVWYQCIHNYR